MRRELPIAITILVGLLMVLKFFFESVPWIYAAADEMEKWGMVIGAFAYVLGGLNLLRVNGRVIVRGGGEAPYKAALVAALVAMTAVGLVEFHLPGRRELGEGTIFHWFYRYAFTPLSAAMFALLAFFIASAAFRAFRARNLHATLLLAAGVTVMLGRVPLGNLLTGGIAGEAQRWIMNNPSLAGQRAIIIGAALGMVAAGLRILLGIDRPYLE